MNTQEIEKIKKDFESKIEHVLDAFIKHPPCRDVIELKTILPEIRADIKDIKSELKKLNLLENRVNSIETEKKTALSIITALIANILACLGIYLSIKR